ncbi:MAG: NADH-quinone oxidoreductase subunit C [Prevotellaceae bacterium]|jgi:Ni,Fe-hydrogenase III large subunit|nr:NADH-quinone oxidoreductase subunit C [Prevotellaceae bacterium]
MVEVENGSSLDIGEIPIVSYNQFYAEVDRLMENTSVHCVSYYAVPSDDNFTFYCCLADDEEHKLYVLGHEQKKENVTLPSLTSKHYAFHCFEREIHENFGINFSDHPWLKPIRYPANRYNQHNVIENYPFYSIDSDELHEVGVGPIHAGVIEPGHFRFICNGEKVLHLEIMLGYQHRGVEELMLTKHTTLRRSILVESIAGDTAIGHSLAFAMNMESLAGIDVPDRLQLERIIALELERIAIHIGDTGALCMDIAYQLGQVACEALRTIVINTTQLWCGNRFGKGFIRPAGSGYPLTSEVARQVLENMETVEQRYKQLTNRIYTLPSVLARFEEIGILTPKQAHLTGIVGPAAKASSHKRDIRFSHPFQYYRHLEFLPVVMETGDVLSRAMMRRYEVEQSIELVKLLLKKRQSMISEEVPKPNYSLQLKPNTFSISLVEGWRGEICHSAITDENGNIVHYKVKDPSLHSWMGLALAVRNQEISDFPICNKSFNLSYCGHDL